MLEKMHRKWSKVLIVTFFYNARNLSNATLKKMTDFYEEFDHFIYREQFSPRITD